MYLSICRLFGPLFAAGAVYAMLTAVWQARSTTTIVMVILLQVNLQHVTDGLPSSTCDFLQTWADEFSGICMLLEIL